VPIRAGERVALSTALAARDPLEYDEPDKIDFNRQSRPLSFGTGPHLCVGIHLAKREMRCAIEEFFAAIPQFRLAPDARIESDLGTIMMPFQLHLEW
jgi:cytochrome P450